MIGGPNQPNFLRPTTTSLLGLILGIFLIYGALQNPGYLDATDAEARFVAVSSLIERGEISVRLRVTPDVVGPIKYTITSALGAWPFVLLGRAVDNALPGTASEVRDIQWFVLGHAFYAALACGLLAWMASLIGARPRQALALALLTALGTVILHYARSAQTEGLCALLLLATLAGAWWHAGQPGPLRAALTGIPMGLLISTKIELGVCLPALAAHLAWRAYWHRPQVGQPKFGWTGVIGSLGGLGLGLFPGVAWTASWNWLRYGNPFSAGYGKIRLQGESDGAFSTPLLLGLWQALLSPGKSVFLYAPLLVPALFGWARGLGARGRGLPWLVAGMTVPTLILYGMWFSPMGGTALGPRFHVSLIPMICLGLVGLWRGSSSSPFPFAAPVVLAFLAGLAVQIAFCLSSYTWHYNETLPEWTAGDRARVHHELIGDWRLSPIAAAISDGWQGYSDLRWLIGRPLSDGYIVRWPLPVGLAMGWLLLIGSFVFATKAPPKPWVGTIRWDRVLATFSALAILALSGRAFYDGNQSRPVALIRDRGTGDFLWQGPVVGLQRHRLDRSRILLFGTRQFPNLQVLSGHLRVEKSGTYDFRWVTDTPGQISLQGIPVAAHPDWTTTQSVVLRFRHDLAQGLVPIEIKLDDLNWNRRGFHRLEWGRNGRPLQPIGIRDILAP